MSLTYKEADYEQSIIELFTKMGYDFIHGPDVLDTRNVKSPFYDEELEDMVRRLNRQAARPAIEEALRKLRHIEAGELTARNEVFMDYLQNGISVSYREKGEVRADLIYLVDYAHPERNSFLIANQWTMVENSTKRPDVVIFLNGIPVVVMELKSPSREETEVEDAYRQLRNYMHEIPSLFVYNAFLIISDQLSTKAGTITSGLTRFMEWKSVDGAHEDRELASFDTLFLGMFEKKRFLDILKNFICFSEEGTTFAKILAGYHQYFAVRKAIAKTERAMAGDGKIGVFWHTQGSGKSLSMVFYAHLLREVSKTVTLVALTDRNDLDGQLYSQFTKCRDFLHQTPVQTENREHLKRLLLGKQANGIIFSTIQKFEEEKEPLSTRRDIVVMADEAHRSQYGLLEHIRFSKNEKGEEVARRVVGMARNVRNALPRASYIGFTGTPVSCEDRNTREVFGDYIDVYDMTQAVEDGATCPVYYESRVMALKLDPKVMKRIDAAYDEMAQRTEQMVIEKSKRDLSQMEVILGNDRTIDLLVRDMISHYEENRAHLLTGKAMIVAYSRGIAMKIYEKILSLRPAWKEKVAVVMTESNKDPEAWHAIVGNKRYREELAKRFKDNDDSFKIAIVVDMWLTGFDVPSLATMYVYKPMKGCNLMQAIARVNRVFRDKEGGLIVDYVGIASALKQAMNDYTRRDRKNYGDMDIGRAAYPKFLEKLEVCRRLISGYDMGDFFGDSDLARARAVTGGVNFMLAPERREKLKDFFKQALLLHQALSLCSSIVEERLRMEASFFETIRVLLVRFTNKGDDRKLSLQEVNRRVEELLKQSIQSGGVKNLFADAEENFSLFDPKFLAEISKMKEKNIAVELLKKLIDEEVQLYRRTNVVKSENFSDILQRTMNRYLNGQLSNAEVIEELLSLARTIAKAHEEGEKLGLSEEEKAFYDALARPQAAQEVKKDDRLIALAKELTEKLRKSQTIDWQYRESARARMRMMIRHLLDEFKYPQEKKEEALGIVMQQCELWAEREAQQDSLSYSAAHAMAGDGKAAEEQEPYGR